jgi:hypothetical protein
MRVGDLIKLLQNCDSTQLVVLGHLLSASVRLTPSGYEEVAWIESAHLSIRRLNHRPVAVLRIGLVQPDELLD